MLEELKISSIGGISRAELNFSSGFVAVTGESGAGKSSLVRGLELVCGKRSMTGTIRAGDNGASVEAFFYVDGGMPGLEGDLAPEDGSLCLRRELSRTGRGKCLVQGHTVPLNTLSETASRLISIQSQFAQLELLNPQRQLDILDACGGSGLIQVKKTLEDLFYRIIEDEKQLRTAKGREAEIMSRYKDFDRISPYLEKFNITPESEEALNAEYDETERELKRLKSLRGYIRMLQASESGGIISELSGILDGAVSCLSGDTRSEMAERCAQAVSAIESVAQDISSLATAERIDDLESTLEKLETSLGNIRKLKRLAKAETVAELLEYWNKGREETGWVREFSKTQVQLKEKIAQEKRDIASAARTLRSMRQAAAAALQERVSANLADLAMANADFRILIDETTKIRAYGTETCEFVLVRAGNEIPVAKAASGGELSRILLAIQASLPDEMLPPTLIFDEVEAGLGGRAAYLAGLKLRSMADRAQVILITHEATIAAMADSHYRVVRTGNLSEISLIDGEERVGEIARMLAGNPDDPEARNHARKLLGGSADDAGILFDPETLSNI